MTYYVYILTNANKNLIYIGVTNDLIRRVYEHKHHLDRESFTSKYNIDQLVYFEETSDVEAAIAREKQLKGWNRARKNKLVEGKNPEWDDIYTQILRIWQRVKKAPKIACHSEPVLRLVWESPG